MSKMPPTNSVIPAHLTVILANAGIQFVAHVLDSRLRGNDANRNAQKFRLR